MSGKQVTRLEYHAYTPLAMKTLLKILLEARSIGLPSPFVASSPSSPPATNSVRSISIIHRLGIVPVGQTSILIAVSAPHRREAFEVCEWILEAVKKDVQVWKREWYAPSNMRTSSEQRAEEEGPYLGRDGSADQLVEDNMSPHEDSMWKANT